MAQGEPREERLGVVEEAPSAGEGERIEVAAGPGVGAGVGLVVGRVPGTRESIVTSCKSFKRKRYWSSKSNIIDHYLTFQAL